METLKDIILLFISLKLVASEADFGYLTELPERICSNRHPENALQYCHKVRNHTESTFTIGNSCYHLVENPDAPTTRELARSDCQSRNGDLITIKSEETQNSVLDAINKMADSHTVLLGLKKEGGQWKWVDGEVVTYSNWEASSQSQPGDCGRLNAMEAGRWEKINCGSPGWFTIYICEHNKQTDSGANNSGAGILSKYSLSSLAATVVTILLVCFAHS